MIHVIGSCAETILKKVKLGHVEPKSDSGEQAHTIAISFNFILGLIIACLWCLSFVR